MLRAPYIPQLTSTALALEIITYGSGPFHALLNPWMRPYSFRMAMMRLKISANTPTQKKNVVSFVLCAKPRENRKLPTHLTNDAKGGKGERKGGKQERFDAGNLLRFRLEWKMFPHFHLILYFSFYFLFVAFPSHKFFVYDTILMVFFNPSEDVKSATRKCVIRNDHFNRPPLVQIKLNKMK